MATLSKIKPGQILWSVIRRKMGNTSMSTDSLHKVKVLEVDIEAGFALVSWNGNAPTKYYERQLKSLKVNEPQPKHVGIYGNIRY